MKDQNYNPSAIARIEAPEPHLRPPALSPDGQFLPVDSWQAAFDALTEPALLMDVNCHIRSFNQAARNLYGSDIIGRPCWEVVHGTKGRAEACSFPCMIRSRQRVSADMQIGEQWFKVSVDPLFDSQGEIIGALHIMRDFTQQKLAEDNLRAVNEQIEQRVAERTAELETASQALRESEEKFYLLFATVPDAVFVFDAQSRKILEANEAALRMYGYTREELAHLTVMDLTAEPAASEQSISHTTTSGPNFIPLRYHRKKDGTIFPVEISASAFVIRGRPVFCGIIRNISRRKQSEEALLESNARLKKVLSIETVGIMFWDVASGTMTDANDTLLNWIGYTRAEMEAGELTWEKLTPPEFLEVSREQLRRFGATDRVGPYEKEYLCKDGSRRWFLFAGSGLGNGSLVEFCVDISAFKKVAADLRMSEERYRALVEQSPDGLFVLDDSANHILDLNSTSRQMFGYSAEEISGMTITSLLAPGEIKRIPMEIAKLEAGDTVVTEWLAQRKDGSEFHAEVRARKLSDGRIQGFVRDITERRQTEQRLLRFQRVKAILTGVEHAIIHIQNQKRLLTECCEVAVQKGGFKLAWIGMVKPDGAIHPVAKAGDTAYLQLLHPVIQNVPEGQGPVGTAIRENHPVIIQDLEHDTSAAPWRKKAKEYGMSYAAAFPLRISGKPVGSFQVYAPRDNFFDRDEISLLTQVCDEISFALTALDIAAKRRQAESELKKSERDLADFFTNSPVGLLWVAENGNVLRVNQAVLELLGHTEKNFVGKPFGQFQIDPESTSALLVRLAAGETVHNYHTRLRHKNGDILHVLIDANGLWEKHRLQHSRWFIRDITRRVELEREVLTAAEQERHRLGQDLHDDLCQQLTGIHFLSEALTRNLTDQTDPNATDAREIVALARTAVHQAREMAHGLSPLQMEAEGLMEGLAALATHTQRVFRRTCDFHCADPVLIHDHTVALHLYRIAQEAVNNAIKHGQADQIDIQLKADGNRVMLAIRDYGTGLPETAVRQKGMGLRIMQYRAGLIGGSLVVQRKADCGTEVVCTVHDGLLPLDENKPI